MGSKWGFAAGKLSFTVRVIWGITPGIQTGELILAGDKITIYAFLRAKSYSSLV